MTPETSFLYFLAVLVFAITPGPGVFAVLARALAFGANRCLAIIFGIVISDIIYLLLACKGLSYMAENWNQIFALLRLVGAVYLILLGWKIWHAPVRSCLTEKSIKPKRDTLQSFVQGFFISASNPKVILFYLAFLPTFIDLHHLVTSDLLFVVFLTFSGLSLALIVIARGGALARKHFRSELAMGRLNKTAGVTMMGAGVFLASRP